MQRQARVFADRQRSVLWGEGDVFHGRSHGRIADGIEKHELVAQMLDHVLPDERELPAAVVAWMAIDAHDLRHRC
jgi:hypothetical protein